MTGYYPVTVGWFLSKAAETAQGGLSLWLARSPAAGMARALLLVGPVASRAPLAASASTEPGPGTTGSLRFSCFLASELELELELERGRLRVGANPSGNRARGPGQIRKGRRHFTHLASSSWQPSGDGHPKPAA